jgi:hypothetical protein
MFDEPFPTWPRCRWRTWRAPPRPGHGRAHRRDGGDEAVRRLRAPRGRLLARSPVVARSRACCRQPLARAAGGGPRVDRVRRVSTLRAPDLARRGDPMRRQVPSAARRLYRPNSCAGLHRGRRAFGDGGGPCSRLGRSLPRRSPADEPGDHGGRRRGRCPCSTCAWPSWPPAWRPLQIPGSPAKRVLRRVLAAPRRRWYGGAPTGLPCRSSVDHARAGRRGRRHRARARRGRGVPAPGSWPAVPRARRGSPAGAVSCGPRSCSSYGCAARRLSRRRPARR